MKVFAVVHTFGRRQVREFLACWERQTVRVPLLIWVDRAPELVWTGAIPEASVVHDELGPTVLENGCMSLGPLRARAIAWGRKMWPDAEAVLICDDDDFYAPHHVETTVLALERGAAWTGGRVVGLEEHGRRFLSWGTMAPNSPGPNATRGMRFSIYDAAGGFQADQYEDTELERRMMAIEPARTHATLTWVYRRHGANFSQAYRDDVRAAAPRALELEPEWTDDCERLARWTQERQPWPMSDRAIFPSWASASRR